MNRRHGTHVILGAIAPAYDAIDAETLTYPNLRTVLQSQNLPSFVLRNSTDLWRRRLGLHRDAFREDWRAAYLLSVAYRLQKSWTMPEKMFWSSQFTTTSVKLFGRPLSREVSSIAADELQFFESMVTQYEIDETFAEPVLSAYRSLLSPRATKLPPLEERYRYVLARIHEHYRARYSGCFHVFDAYDPQTLLQPADIVEAFDKALDSLKAQDPAWQPWKVSLSKSSKLAVNVGRRQIIVGRQRAPLHIQEVRALFAHEVLVHALRAVKGAQLHPELMVGLPSYLTAEEGLGVLVESAIHHSVPHKVKDRYVDVALALGARRRRPLLRRELYAFCYTRSVLRSIAQGDNIDLDQLERVTWEHVNRIYRGSLGNRYVAVFTKDVAYYKGFIKIANYLARAEQKGKFDEAMTRLNTGKIDPTNPDHARYVRSLRT